MTTEPCVTAAQRSSGVLRAGLAAWVCLACLAAPAPLAAARDRYDFSQELKLKLRSGILPYWYDTAQDTNQGGYLLADAVTGRGQAREKQLVTQARMIWGLSHAHRKGYSTPERDYLKAAAQGYGFLQEHLRDKEHGGYFWTTDLSGRVRSDRKILYGQAFVMYALVEFHRASGDPEPLRQARELYDTLQKRAHDDQHDGWYEHFERDWRPILQPGPGTEVEVAGYKSANTHLHMMEALAELAEATGDDAVMKSLAEALSINQKYFYPKRPGNSCFHRKPDWRPVTDPKSAGLSYGHNVEFAWLMIRAEAVLGRKPSWAHFEAHLRHALKYGCDHERGGLYNRGADDRPATDTDKVWWVQAEMLAALTVAAQHRPEKEYIEPLEKLLDFVVRYQADRDGIWVDTMTAEGTVKNPAKANNWKANYHDVRGMVMFIEAFPPTEKAIRQGSRGR